MMKTSILVGSAYLKSKEFIVFIINFLKAGVPLNNTDLFEENGHCVCVR